VPAKEDEPGQKEEAIAREKPGRVGQQDEKGTNDVGGSEKGLHQTKKRNGKTKVEMGKSEWEFGTGLAEDGEPFLTANKG